MFISTASQQIIPITYPYLVRGYEGVVPSCPHYASARKFGAGMRRPGSGIQLLDTLGRYPDTLSRQNS